MTYFMTDLAYALGLVLPFAVPAAFVVLAAVWCLLVWARGQAAAEIRECGPRPSYRRVLAEVRAERAAHGVPASFEQEAA